MLPGCASLVASPVVVGVPAMVVARTAMVMMLDGVILMVIVIGYLSRFYFHYSNIGDCFFEKLIKAM